MPKRKTSGLFFSLGCGCKDSTAVSVSNSTDRRHLQPLAPQSSVESITHTTTASSSSPWNIYEDHEEEEEEEEEDFISTTDTPSFSGLLQQLNELEQNLREWSNKKIDYDEQEPLQQQHRYSSSSSIAESVAVVKETEDPLSDFRSSMLLMIVEKELVSGDELRELLHRFLSLNSPKHHEVILRAFTEIWDEVFSGYERTPDLKEAWL